MRLSPILKIIIGSTIAVIIFVVSALAYAGYTYPSKHAEYGDCVEDTEIIAKSDYIKLLELEGQPAENIETKTHNQEYTRQNYLDNRIACDTLKSQWNATDVTHYAYWAGIVGVFLVFATLLATAASVWIARTTAKKQLRAYIGFSEIGIRHIMGTEDNYDETMAQAKAEGISDKNIGFPIQVSVFYKNGGDTPGKITAEGISCAIVDLPIDDESIPVPAIKDTQLSILPNIPNFVTANTENPLTEQDYAMLITGSAVILVAARIEYADIYGQPHFTNICFYNTPFGGINPQGWEPHNKGNETT